jgi:hypothetical protein
MTKKYGFIYLWYDRKHKRYYIGAHFGTIDDGYICSSKWMRDAYRYRPHDFKRRIIETGFETTRKMFESEDKWLSMIKEEELGKRYYNLRKNWQHWSMDSNITFSVREKVSRANKGRKCNLSPEQLIERGKKISEAKLASFQRKFDETGRKMPEGHQCGKKTGYKHTEEWKAANSARLKQQYASGVRKTGRNIPKRMTKEEQRKHISELRKKNWSDPIWRAKQIEKLKIGASNRKNRESLNI